MHFALEVIGGGTILNNQEKYSTMPLISTLSGRSSGVERNLAKVEVEGSNPFARSNVSAVLYANNKS